MNPYNFNAETFDACLQHFLAEHPQLAVESHRVAQHTGRDEIWLSLEDAVEFFDWARHRHYISATEAQRAITYVRELGNAYHNQRQHLGEG
jgi:hypothetical protein